MQKDIEKDLEKVLNKYLSTRDVWMKPGRFEKSFSLQNASTRRLAKSYSNLLKLLHPHAIVEMGPDICTFTDIEIKVSRR